MYVDIFFCRHHGVHAVRRDIFFTSCHCYRALFYQHNPYAAKGKTQSTAKTKVDSAQESSSLASFPTTGWSSDRSLLPAVDAGTILSHLIRTGKGPSAAHADTQEVTIVQKPLRRGQDFFFCGYVHDVCVCRKGGHCFLKGKCFASQKKAVKYEQGIQLTEGENGASVLFAACKGCPAGADGGLCQHVFALLLAVEHYGPKKEGNMPGEQSKTSMKQSWGPRTGCGTKTGHEYCCGKIQAG